MIKEVGAGIANGAKEVGKKTLEVVKDGVEKTSEITGNELKKISNINIDSRIKEKQDVKLKKTGLEEINIEKRIESIEKFKNKYIDELLSMAKSKETLDKKSIVSEFKNIKLVDAEESKKLRREFNANKNDLIAKWEKMHGTKWPTYDKDVYDPKTGKKIREAGQRLDAHHIKPLKLGGLNDCKNITPLDASIHYDKRGIHREDGPLAKLMND